MAWQQVWLWEYTRYLFKQSMEEIGIFTSVLFYLICLLVENYSKLNFRHLEYALGSHVPFYDPNSQILQVSVMSLHAGVRDLMQCPHL